MNPDFSEDIYLSVERQAGYCRALGSPERVLILWLLMEKEMSLTEIAAAIGASMPSTSRHLNILRTNRLIISWQDAGNVYYSIAENKQTQSCLVLKNKPNIKLTETTGQA
jgi:DNA-binding transcriptional ArsR family regulator